MNVEPSEPREGEHGIVLGKCVGSPLAQSGGGKHLGITGSGEDAANFTSVSRSSA